METTKEVHDTTPYGEQRGLSTQDKVFRIGGSTIGGVVLGGALGSTAGPVGSGIGAVIGGAIGLSVSVSDARKHEKTDD